ncbi:uncharacterized protein [Diadema antillarum]|uniref:uncharacterized protein n=1 Tax=Diadema antillarum TaxID=105358 RepID=UPI003A87532F
MEDNLKQVTQLVLSSTLDHNSKCSRAVPDVAGNRSNQSCNEKAGDESKGRSYPSQNQDEQQDLERLRAKQIVMDAILLEQTKINHCEEDGVAGAKIGLDVAQQCSHGNNSSAEKGPKCSGAGQSEVRTHCDESKILSGECRTGAVASGELGGGAENGDCLGTKCDVSIVNGNKRSGVSISSRVKRFSMSEDLTDQTQRQVDGVSLPTTDSKLEPETIVMKRRDPEMKRSVLSVTVTTSEDASSGPRLNGCDEGEKQRKAIVEETENVVWRVRNRKKFKEKANPTVSQDHN